MKFCEFFGGGENLHPSRLAQGWRMPHRLRPARTAARHLAEVVAPDAANGARPPDDATDGHRYRLP